MAVSPAPTYSQPSTEPRASASEWDGPHRACFLYYQRDLQQCAQGLMDRLAELHDIDTREPSIDVTLGETRCPACGRIVRLERALALGRWVVYGRDGRQHWCQGTPVAPSAIEAADAARQPSMEV